MHTNRRRISSALLLLTFSAGTLLVLSSWVAAEGPIAGFPLFTPLQGFNKVEGVGVDKVGNVYVSVQVGELVQILKFSPDGEQSPFADIGIGESGGIAVSANGDIFTAVAVGSGRGVYRVDRDGNAVRLPGTEQIVFANALSFDPRGDLFVTESYSRTAEGYGQGGIWRIPPQGEAELWLRDDLLTGIGVVLGYPVGANGIAYYHGDLYVVNCDKASLYGFRSARTAAPVNPMSGKRLRTRLRDHRFRSRGTGWLSMCTATYMSPLSAGTPSCASMRTTDPR